jgi:hypothetical protein
LLAFAAICDEKNEKAKNSLPNQTRTLPSPRTELSFAQRIDLRRALRNSNL